MTRAFTPSPASTPTRTPAGHTKAAPTHGTKAQSSCRGDIRGRSHLPFERLNTPQLRADRRSDWISALPPVWVLLISAGVCLFALLVADTIYSAFFDWMVTR